MRRRIIPSTCSSAVRAISKKITPQSLRMSATRSTRRAMAPASTSRPPTNTELMFFTDRQQVYKTCASEFGETKASLLGDPLSARQAGAGCGENVIFLCLPGDYSGSLLFRV